uniref:Oxysterol binding protein like 8 n=1 Tax=Pavo cristatus TaxID=9049 RepID=A0A8C9F453_PAVCR
MSQRQGKEAYFTPTKELLQPSLSPATAHSHGFDKGKDDASQSKEDTAHSMSKSKVRKAASVWLKNVSIVELKIHLAFIFCRLNDSEIERHHFKDQDMYSDKSDKENDHEHDESDNDGLGKSEESDSDTSERQDDSYVDPEPIDIRETTYLEQSHEELGEVQVLFMYCTKYIAALLGFLPPYFLPEFYFRTLIVSNCKTFLENKAELLLSFCSLAQMCLPQELDRKSLGFFFVLSIYKFSCWLFFLAGILYGTMTLELGGTVNITCEKTGYSATIEFKLKPFLGNNDSVNQISGKIKLGKEVLAILEGHWDSEVTIRDKKTDVSETFWNPTSDIKQRRLPRYTVKFEEQDDFESEKLWQQVTKAINNKDQTEATQEKYVLEEAQRKSAKERKLKGEEWTCKLFDQDPVTGEWHYRYADTRPWDPLNDMIQFEKDGTIQTKVRHRTPMVSVPKIKRKPTSQKKGECGFSSPEPDNQDSSGSEAQLMKHNTRIRKKGADLGELQSAIESIKETQEDIKRDIMALRNRVTSNSPPVDNQFLQLKHYIFILLLVLLQLIINFLFK